MVKKGDEREQKQGEKDRETRDKERRYTKEKSDV